MASVALRSISKSFGGVPVLSGIDLDVADGEFLTLVGASGCGKSTLIRIIAGLEPQSSGSVLIDGAPVDHLRPHERHVAMVFQSYALYPHMRVHANIALPLVMSRLRLVGAAAAAAAALLAPAPDHDRDRSRGAGGRRAAEDRGAARAAAVAAVGRAAAARRAGPRDGPAARRRS